MKNILFTLFLLLASWQLPAATFTVTNAGDSPTQPTLRWAINQANITAGADDIVFSIGLTAPVTIQLDSSLPKITEMVTIDGSTQPGTAASGNDILINGLTQQNPAQNAYLFVFYLTESAGGTNASGSIIQNITLEGLDHVPTSGGIIPGHQTYAFFLDGVDNCEIRNNILKDVDGNGMIIKNGSDNNVIQGNIFGTDASLTGNHPVVAPMTIGSVSHLIRNDGNVIGGLGVGQKNFFYNMPANGSNYHVITIFWGIHNRISGNEFVNNGAAKIVVDGLNASWCGNVQECKVPPSSLQAELITTGLQVSGFSTVQGSPAVGDTVEIFTSDNTGDDAVFLLGIVIVPPGNGFWSVVLPASGVAVNDWIVATTSDQDRNTSAFRRTQVFCNNSVPTISGVNGTGVYNIDFQAGVQSCFSVYSSDLDGDGINLFSWDFSTVLPNGSFTTINNHTPNVTGNICWTPSVGQVGQTLCFSLHAADSLICGHDFATQQFCITVIDTLPPCPNCISSFRPIEGKAYLVSAWAREENPPLTKTHFDRPEIYVDFGGLATFGPFTAKGDIIDGWQRIEGEFTVPAGAGEIRLRLESTLGDVFFDDVRVLPFDGHMVNYVYDHKTMRLMAELDERHYAKFYEYDEEGKLMRVKKETEKGIMTLEENRHNSPK